MSGRLTVAAVFLVLQLITYEGVQGWSDYCKTSDVVGTWVLNREASTRGNYKSCNQRVYRGAQHRVTLHAPNVATDDIGNYGHWTLFFGVGIEVTIQGRKYFSTFPWGWRSIDCRRLNPGSSINILSHNYACFDGAKSWRENDTKMMNDGSGELSGDDVYDPTEANFVNDPTPTNVPTFDSEKMFEIDHELIKKINEDKEWKATAYKQFEDLTEADIILLAGGNMTLRGKPPNPAPRTAEQLNKTLTLPTSFDWRNNKGVNYVSGVRDQGRCGSCYAFAATAMYESRLRIMTKNSARPILSPQDVIECSPYSEGCGGGWVFTEGKFAEEFGFVDEICNIYSARVSPCSRDTTCEKYYATDYQFVGGYFGATNDLEMMYSLYYNGPFVVVLSIYRDFFYYESGIYYHFGDNSRAGLHAVTVVGWGTDRRSGTKYWIVKNSWGKWWGEDGYFRIARGNNNCDIESLAVEAFPMI